MVGDYVGETVVTCGLVVEQRTHHQITGERASAGRALGEVLERDILTPGFHPGFDWVAHGLAHVEGFVSFAGSLKALAGSTCRWPRP